MEIESKLRKALNIMLVCGMAKKTSVFQTPTKRNKRLSNMSTASDMTGFENYKRMIKGFADGVIHTPSSIRS